MNMQKSTVLDEPRSKFNPGWTIDLKSARAYKCPACGEYVDRADVTAVLLHHQHVLHPELYRVTSQSSDYSGPRQPGLRHQVRTSAS